MNASEWSSIMIDTGTVAGFTEDEVGGGKGMWEVGGPEGCDDTGAMLGTGSRDEPGV